MSTLTINFSISGSRMPWQNTVHFWQKWNAWAEEAVIFSSADDSTHSPITSLSFELPFDVDISCEVEEEDRFGVLQVIASERSLLVHTSPHMILRYEFVHEFGAGVYDIIDLNDFHVIEKINL